uniref:NAD(P)H-quinone oxidoreductase subunit 5, chloroplastic n=1 Tax=Coleochaete scutata TaxID=3125 RepID=A0A191T5K9_COLSC|nr:subunit 5 of NADH-plastoquinone oxidoreductase [Coleochaete scutata]ANI25662.1 subunit 5 of NADH-plastoquinone oxidoreductase [Coleochaete scutata]
MKLLFQYAWIIPLLPCLGSIIIGVGLLSFRRGSRSLRYLSSLSSIGLMSISMILSFLILIEEISNNIAYKYLWPWIITDNLNIEIGYLIDPLSSVMLVLVTTVAVTVMIYSDGYMSHDQGYIRFFCYLGLFTASMLGLILSPNLIQVYAFWELIGMCSYLLIGFWFTRPVAASACQKAFVTNRVGDFGLLLGILGFYWLTNSFEFDTIQDRLYQLINNNSINLTFTIICAILLFLGPIAKSAQFPLHIWLPDAMEGPTPISALIHAATMVAAGIFLVARLFPIFEMLPLMLDIIAWIGAITAILGASLAIAQPDLKRSLAYSTMSQLGYMMLALGIGSYEAGIFHLITHAYSKALLFLASGSVIHGMEPVVGYNPNKSQDMTWMGGMRQHMPITGITFLIGTLSLCGIPPFACFWSKDIILSETWNHSPILGIIAWSTAGLTGFYMFRMYLLTFEGDFRGSIILKENSLDSLIITNKKLNQNENSLKDSKNKKTSLYPKESTKNMVIPLMILMIPTITIGCLELPFDIGIIKSHVLSNWLIGSSNLEFETEFDWLEFLSTAAISVAIASIGISSALILYSPKSLSKRNVNELLNPIPKNTFSNFIKNFYNWSINRAYIDKFYEITCVQWTNNLSNFTSFMDKWILDAIVNGAGVFTLLSGESLRYGEVGQISSYILVILISITTLICFGIVIGNLIII